MWPVIQEALGNLEKEDNAGKKILWSFLASGVVQFTTLPIVLWFYGEVSVMGIFLNLLVLPTVGVVLGSGTADVLWG